MEKFTIGQVVSITFPFSDLAFQKRRPALIVAIADFDDIILCQITSKPYSSSMPIELLSTNFTNGSLPVNSYIRPDKLFIADSSIVNTVYGTITSKKLSEVLIRIHSLFK